MAENAKVKVLFFGILTEVCGASTVEIEAADMEGLKTDLRSRFPSIGEHSFRISLNQEFILDNEKLKDGDEVALLPPFAGG